MKNVSTPVLVTAKQMVKIGMVWFSFLIDLKNDVCVRLGYGEKRSASDEFEHATKQMKIDDSFADQQGSACVTAILTHDNMANATKNKQNVPTDVGTFGEVTDEELLEMAVMLEAAEKKNK